MTQIYFTRKPADNRTEMFFAELPRTNKTSSPIPLNEVGESSSFSADFISIYESLPHHLMCCLDYFAILTQRYPMEKDKMIRLLMPEFIQEKEGENLDDVAKLIIEEFIDLGMLGKSNIFNEIGVAKPYSKLCLVEVDEMEFLAKAAYLPVRAIIEDDGKDIPPDFGTLRVRSLFLITADRRSSSFNSTRTRGLSPSYIVAICKLQHLLVLDVDGMIERLPEAVGDLVHLRYLGLSRSNLDELPPTLANLQNLQTLDIAVCGRLNKLPIQVLNIQQLRHLIMSNTINNGEIRVPSGIGTLKNLHALDGVYAGGGIASELSSLFQLQKLGVRRVSEDHATELSAAIMKMENLVYLSLQADGCYNESFLPELESLSPPSSIQELALAGGLGEMPVWLASMENLTVLSLVNSNLSENPSLTLQFLPKLKLLKLWKAYNKIKCIGKEFCEAGGFPKLETLVIASEFFLVEWTEIVNAAFPSLRCLEFHNCMRLRFLPEGLQNISTLEELVLFHTHEDLPRRLLSEERYKIKHILRLYY